jgi:hypothetical protein
LVEDRLGHSIEIVAGADSLDNVVNIFLLGIEDRFNEDLQRRVGSFRAVDFLSVYAFPPVVRVRIVDAFGAVDACTGGATGECPITFGFPSPTSYAGAIRAKQESARIPGTKIKQDTTSTEARSEEIESRDIYVRANASALLQRRIAAPPRLLFSSRGRSRSTG